MKIDCKNCEYRGYSPEFCMMHKKHCSKESGTEPKELPPPVKIGARALLGAGVGVGVVILGLGAVSLVGGVALFHGALLKLGAGAGLAGGGIGIFKGLADNRDKSSIDEILDKSFDDRHALLSKHT